MKELVEKRCRRAIAIVLSAKEREADPYIDAAAQARLRRVVMEEFNDFAALVTDILESVQKDIVFNELWLAKLEEIHGAVVVG